MNKLWFVPIISLILIICIGVAVQLTVDSNAEEASKAITIDNITNSIVLDYGYYTGELNAKFVSTKSMSANVVVEFYDESGSKISDADSYALTEANVEPNQKYTIKATYFNSQKPSKAIIKVYDDLGTSNLIYSKEVNFS